MSRSLAVLIEMETPVTLSIFFFQVKNDERLVKVQFTPTIPHCSMATLIGLSIRVKLLRSLPAQYKVDVLISPGSHASEAAGIFFFFYRIQAFPFARLISSGVGSLVNWSIRTP